MQACEEKLDAARKKVGAAAEHGDLSENAEYEAAIRQKVERNWIRPSTAGSGASCEVMVEQDPGGGVMSVQVRSCEGDQAFRHSVETAVKRASPLPTPADPALFDRNIEFIFKPEG